MCVRENHHRTCVTPFTFPLSSSTPPLLYFSTPHSPTPYPSPMPAPRIIDLGRMSYADAYALQLAHHEEVLAAREAAFPPSHPPSDIPHPTSADPGRILLVEHDPPVITISRRAGARDHLTATPDMLARAGVEIAETDRGGDITYHGPGQLVVYPILDLNYYHLGLHAYMRLMEQAIIDAIATWGITGKRDPAATGVWVQATGTRDQGMKASREENGVAPALSSIPQSLDASMPSSKIAALGVRVRRWVSMHGLALNVSTNLDHFNLIVPCGLAGRGVTSMQLELRERAPAMNDVKTALTASLVGHLRRARESAAAASDAPLSTPQTTR